VPGEEPVIHDFDLPAHVQELRAKLRAFVDECVIPLEGKSRAGNDLIPEVRASLEAEAQRRGLWNLYVPPEFGGNAKDLLSRLIVVEEIARTTAVHPRRPLFGPQPGAILFTLNDKQKERYLYPVLRGEKKHAFAQTEPGAGGDPANMSTTAVRDGDHYVINGTKRFIGFANEADFIQVVALTDPVKRARGGISVFLVDVPTPGFRVVREMPTMFDDKPWEIEFENVRVPAENLVGTEGDGFKYAQQWITENRLNHVARAIGITERCLELSVVRAKGRTTFGAALAERQAVQFMLVDMYQHLYQMRLMMYDVARRLERGEDVRHASYMCKYFGDEAGFAAADRAMQIHGAMGLTSDYPIETFFRESRGFIITEGPTEMLKMVVARKVLQEYDNPTAPLL
jgi:acyl-CoA dehydrogenase